MPTHAVTVEGFEPFTLDEHTPMLEGCEDAGVPMDSACGGFATCNACRVEVIAGLENTTDPAPEEAPFLDAPNHRLGCQVCVRGPVSVRLAPGM